MLNSKISGVGIYVPDNIIRNDDLESMMNTSDEWIQERTGIKERRWVNNEKLTTSQMGTYASENAIEDAGISKDVLQILDLPWAANADDAVISVAAGCGMICADPFAENEEVPSTQKARAAAIEEWLAGFASSIRGRMADLGIDALEKLTRRHLRALEHETAAQSGLRLAGYDRPLPQWLGQ